MKPIKFKEQNKVMLAPKGMEKDCESLNCHFDTQHKQYISKWKLSWRERLKILFTGHLWLGVNSFALPPVWMSTEFPFVRPPKKLQRMISRVKVRNAVRAALRDAAKEQS